MKRDLSDENALRVDPRARSSRGRLCSGRARLDPPGDVRAENPRDVVALLIALIVLFALAKLISRSPPVHHSNIGTAPPRRRRGKERQWPSAASTERRKRPRRDPAVAASSDEDARSRIAARPPADFPGPAPVSGPLKTTRRGPIPPHTSARSPVSR